MASIEYQSPVYCGSPMSAAELPHFELHEAVRACIKDRLSQTAAARALGVSQSAISQWVSGATKPSLNDQMRLALACRRPKDWILRAAGYVEDPTTIEDLLAADSRFDDAGRSVILAAIHGVLDHYGLINRSADDAADGGELQS